MNKAKLIENIKSQLKSLVSNEVKFAEIKAGDLIISSPDEELVVGSEVYTIDEEGNNIPLADGEYTLDNGVKIAVVNGKVEALVSEEQEVEVEVEAEEATDEKKEEEVVEAEEEVKEDEASDDEKTDVEARIAKLEEIVEEMAKKFEEVVKEKEEMKREFSKIAELPSTEPIEVKPSEFKSVETKKSDAGRPDVASIREMIRSKR